MELVGEDVPVVLFVEKFLTRRNISDLIAAFAKARIEKQLPHKFLLLGPNPANLPLACICAKHGVSGALVQTDGKFMQHEKLIPIYNAADVFVHPSWFKGWSMTTIEALACVIATTAANRGGLGDVARGHAYRIAEPTVEALEDALCNVLLDEKLCQELKQLARRRGSAITWEDTTCQTLEVIGKIGQGGPL